MKSTALILIKLGELKLKVTNTNEYISEYTTTNNHDIIDIKVPNCVYILLFEFLDIFDYRMS